MSPLLTLPRIAPSVLGAARTRSASAVTVPWTAPAIGVGVGASAKVLDAENNRQRKRTARDRDQRLRNNFISRIGADTIRTLNATEGELLSRSYFQIWLQGGDNIQQEYYRLEHTLAIRQTTQNLTVIKAEETARVYSISLLSASGWCCAESKPVQLRTIYQRCRSRRL